MRVLQRMPLSTNEQLAPIISNELDMMQEIGFRECPYIIEHYGSMIDVVNEDSSQFCIIMFFLQARGELCICMELMDTTLKTFYETMHLVGPIDHRNLEFLLCRVIHNVNTNFIN